MAEITTSLVPSLAGLESMLEALADLQMKTFKEACQVRRWREWSSNFDVGDPGNLWYCWWTKSCTTRDDDYPIIYRVSTIPGGAGFHPSTVALWLTGMMLFSWKGCLLNNPSLPGRQNDARKRLGHWREWIFWLGFLKLYSKHVSLRRATCLQFLPPTPVVL